MKQGCSNILGHVMNKKRIITIVALSSYIVVCFVLFNSNSKTEKKEPEKLKPLRTGLEKVSNENDPLLREYLLQEEAAKANKSVADYRPLFESYRKNKTEFLPEYPKQKWSIVAWSYWFLKEVSPKKQEELLKNIILAIIEKGTLLTGTIAVGRWLWESPQRRKQEQYQAWQIIHLADGKKNSGARKQAIKDLYKEKFDITGLSADGADLRKIDLRGADLTGASFKKADLRGAVLEGADLREAVLEGAVLEGADLRGANLWGANLTGVNLREANLEGTNLSHATLDKANLCGAIFGEYKGEFTNLTTASLRRANIESVDLTGVDISDACFGGARTGRDCGKDKPLDMGILRTAKDNSYKEAEYDENVCSTYPEENLKPDTGYKEQEQNRKNRDEKIQHIKNRIFVPLKDKGSSSDLLVLLDDLIEIISESIGESNSSESQDFMNELTVIKGRLENLEDSTQKTLNSELSNISDMDNLIQDALAEQDIVNEEKRILEEELKTLQSGKKPDEQ